MSVEINRPVTLESIRQALEEIEAKKKNKLFNTYKHIGKLKNVFNEDAVMYQRKLRHEWE